ncbi:MULTISPECIES: hypothetical protein [Micromonospora]|uniref:Uncharacterized protein n=1 Tax=Micromonospora maris TaxID=1003110 RepID=A0A9X0I4Z5_9ACTN|nr:MULTISPECIES: hypothetical protein [Micromonospora]AEB47858.1 hypothetical protein VAB18032_03880 [Micromonospora maris AB-18-032]KUJ46867.1 hypothetical protein ADL17_28865 [Micromonospora maris]RUL91663.1 hypothetical protein EG812_20400 [Verrucosispora sp. FIM060022]
MDVFSRTFLPAAAEAGLAVQTATRHMPVFRRCVGASDATVLVTRCSRPDRPMSGEYLLLLTHRRLVITRQTRVLHRLRLHLNTELRELSHVTWSPDPRLHSVELAATAIDGIRERFLVRTQHPKQVWQLDALFNHAFRTRVRATRPRVLATVAEASAVRPTTLHPAAAH